MKLNFLRSVSCHLQPVMESAGIYKHNKHHVQTLYQHKHHKNIIQKNTFNAVHISSDVILYIVGINKLTTFWLVHRVNLTSKELCTNCGELKLCEPHMTGLGSVHRLQA